MSKRSNTSRSRSGSAAANDDDAFVAGVLNFSQWAKANQTGLVVFGIVLVAVVFLVVTYTGQRSRQVEQAGVELERIQATLAVGDPEASKVGLSQYLEEFGNTPYAGEAALILAQLYLESDQAELALQALDRAGISLDDPLGPQAFVLQGRAYELTDDYAEAEGAYLQVARSTALTFEARAARADAARMRELQGDYAGAAELYREIVAGFEETDPERGQFEMRLAEAEARM